MRKIFMINFSLMEKIADKKNGITTEDAAAFMTGVELFFLLLIAEFAIVRILPFKVDLWLILILAAIIWYFTHYQLRSIYRKRMVEMKIVKDYKLLSSGERRRYLILSIAIFFGVFLFFFSNERTINWWIFTR